MSDSNIGGEASILEERRRKLEELRKQNIAYVNNYTPTNKAQELHDSHGQLSKEELENKKITNLSVAGRIVLKRVMGNASFVTIRDGSGDIQAYISKNNIDPELYKNFKSWDLGDIIGVTGNLFKTKTEELTVEAHSIILITKSLRPMPEKHKGLADIEIKYRQRYLDLMSSPESKEIFIKRSKIVSFIRSSMLEDGFLEVETPMMHSIPGGAVAKPFITKHNALDRELFLRIAPELHLKRLLVGGFDKVFEINRSFRNEGLSTRHNPEFTMLEAYQAYTDYRGMMELTRSLIQQVSERALGTLQLERNEGDTIDLSGEWREAKYKDLIIDAVGREDWFDLPKSAKLEKAKELRIEVDPALEDFEVTNDIFEKVIEHTLIQPTFVTHIPKELCPLAKITENDSSTIDVFELCINGQEIAPAYSEQNDPAVQRDAFMKQVGEETQELDDDFLLALEHGMPPAGGMGLGIDRLVIFLTKAANIRDTILFPTLRPS